MPYFSIITASYNYAKYIAETMDSVLAQTYQDWELIVVDDGSKDNSVEIIKSYCQKDSRIKLFQHENGINKGLVQTLKLGIEKASGAWIAFLESDDTLTPNALQERFKFLQDFKAVALLYNDMNPFGEKALVDRTNKCFSITKQVLRSIVGKTNATDKLYISPEKYKKYFLEVVIPTFSGVMIKRSVFEDIDFNSPLNYKFDRYLYTQIAIKYGVHFLDKKLTNWRMHGDSQTHTREDPKGRLMFDIAIIKILAQQKLSFWDKIKIARCYLKYIRHTFIRTRGLKITYFMGKKL